MKARRVQPSPKRSGPTVTSNGNGNGHGVLLGGPEEASTVALARTDSTVELAAYTPVVARRTLALQTERAFHVTDVTDECVSFLAETGVQEGVLTVFSEHTTCAVKINERETCFLEDLRLFMEALVPAGAYYRHDDFEIRDPATLAGTAAEEPINGHSHIKQMLLGSASESVPVAAGTLALGRWQRIMFIELDQSRPRSIRLQVQGWR